MAGIALSLLAAYAGPDRLSAVCVYGGRVYVGADAGVMSWRMGEHAVVGGQQIGIVGNAWHTTSADPLVRLDSEEFEGFAAQQAWDQYSQRLSALAALDLVREVRLGRYGYELAVPVQFEDGFAAGIYRVAYGGIDMGIWIGAEPPTVAGHALYDVTDGAWTAVGPSTLRLCSAMLAMDDMLIAAGESTLGERVAVRYDGTAWTELAAPAINALWDADGIVYAIGGGGCCRLRNWSWEQLDWHNGFAGASVAGRQWWTDGNSVRTTGRAITLTSAARDMARHGGRAYVLHEQALALVDGQNVRRVVEWTGPTLDNLSVYQNKLCAFGALDGAPRMLQFGGGQAAFADAGRWRVQRLVPGAQPVAIGTLPDGVGQVVLGVGRGVRLDDLATEWADGSGESPRIGGVATEWSTGPDNRPRLNGFSTEWADGSGESPRLDALTSESTDGNGDSPEVDSVETEWATEGDVQGGGVELAGVSTEWSDELVGPVDGESVVFIVESFGGDVVGVRLVTDEPLSADWRAYMRLNREAADPLSWATYERLPLNANYVPMQTGSELRVAIIGPWAADRCPGVRVQVLTDAS